MENQTKDHLSYAKKAPEATPWIASQSLFDTNIKKCFLIKGSTVIKANIAANGSGCVRIDSYLQVFSCSWKELNNRNKSYKPRFPPKKDNAASRGAP